MNLESHTLRRGDLEKLKAQIRRGSRPCGGEKAGKSVDVRELAKKENPDVMPDAPTSEISGAGVTKALKSASGE